METLTAVDDAGERALGARLEALAGRTGRMQSERQAFTLSLDVGRRPWRERIERRLAASTADHR
ncbi:MAG: hypothetical protein ACU85V_13395 [Gammaproteobacteria bacterium]